MNKKTVHSSKARKFKQGKSLFERSWVARIIGGLFGIGKQY